MMVRCRHLADSHIYAVNMPCDIFQARPQPPNARYLVHCIVTCWPLSAGQSVLLTALMSDLSATPFNSLSVAARRSHDP